MCLHDLVAFDITLRQAALPPACLAMVPWGLPGCASHCLQRVQREVIACGSLKRLAIGKTSVALETWLR